MLPQVPVSEKRLDDYRPIVGEETIAEIRALAQPLRGARVVHINATAYGGGVAEILQTLVPLMRDVGLEAEWQVIEAQTSSSTSPRPATMACRGWTSPSLTR